MASSRGCSTLDRTCILLLLALPLTPAAATELSWRTDLEAPIRLYRLEHRVEAAAPEMTALGLPRRPGFVVAPEDLEPMSGQPALRRRGVQTLEDLVARMLVVGLQGWRARKGTHWAVDQRIELVLLNSRYPVKGSWRLEVQEASGERTTIGFEGGIRLDPTALEGTGEAKVAALEAKQQGSVVFDGAAGEVAELAYTEELVFRLRDQAAPARHTVRVTAGAPERGTLGTLVEAAIARGRQTLAEELAPVRRLQVLYPERPLHAFALVRAGLPADDERIRWALESYGEDLFSDRQYTARSTYGLALYIMALEGLALTRRDPEEDGSGPRYERGRLEPKDRERLARAVELLLAWRRQGEGTWSYGPPEGAAYDYSNTQFAVLALHSAQRAGIAVAPAVWQEVDRQLRQLGKPLPFGERPTRLAVTWLEEAEEEQPGRRRPWPAEPVELLPRGWGYLQLTPPYLGMTAAALSTLAAARDGLGRGNRPRELVDDEVVMAGLAGLASRLGPGNVDLELGNFSHPYTYYTLYSVEKACDLLNVAELNGRDWYREMALWLLGSQGADGRWRVQSGYAFGEGRVSTALALLVLTRATLASNPAVVAGVEVERAVTGEAPSPDAVFLVDRGGWVSLRQVLGDLAAPSGNAEALRELYRTARDGLAALPAERRPVLIPELLTLMGSSEPVLRGFAREALRQIARPGRFSEEALRGLHTEWQELWQQGEQGDAAASPAAREILADRQAHPTLRALACRILGKLEGVEASDELIAALSAREAMVRAAAVEALRQASGQAFAFDPEGPTGKRRAAIERWEAWWAEQAGGSR